MSRIAQTFAQAQAAGRKLLIPYITAGDPHPRATVPLMQALVAAGADILELGVPFSDPMADGPVIQAACERALAQGVSLRGILEMVREFRRQDTRTPVVLMGYLNPIEAMGYAEFAAAAQAAGVDGVLVVDLMPEESEILLPLLRARRLDSIYLVAPTTTEARMDEIARLASGYLYYVSFKGVTGADRLDVAEVAGKLQQLRRHTRLPVAVGFGIRDAESAARVGAVADAVVVGSALVSLIGQPGRDEAALRQSVSQALGDMRRALDEGLPADLRKPAAK
ncbi:MAG TPA: tryptophan synthase subunit alpha [Nevskiales bacterium]|nr:tryptophan synthase subunit alpha [Nevskiales bacterium]